MRKIFKIAQNFKCKLQVFATLQAYNKIKEIAYLAKVLLSHTLELQEQTLGMNKEHWDKDDPYDQVIEERVIQATNLVNDLARISNEFERNAYLYGMSTAIVFEYKNELLGLIGRVEQESGPSKFLDPLKKALTQLEPQPVFKQHISNVPNILKDGPVMKYEQQPLTSEPDSTSKFDLSRIIFPKQEQPPALPESLKPYFEITYPVQPLRKVLPIPTIR